MTTTKSEDAEIVRVSGPAALLALVPHLLGFQPADSVVVVGTAPPEGQVRLTLRYDLPDPPDADIAVEIARHATEVLSAQELRTAAFVGYGPGTRVTPVVEAFRISADRAGIEIAEMLRAEDQRYWSYLCTNPNCCVPEGTPYTLDHPAVQAMASSGKPVLASREVLAATIGPVTGPDAEAMAEATRWAEGRAAIVLERDARPGRPNAGRKRIGAAGVKVVAEVIDRYRQGREMPSWRHAAWLTVVLRDMRVRDDAWCRMEREHRVEHARLWTDLTRFAQPGYVAAPASLLAFVAWQSGNGALANVALDRALDDDPHYRMALLLRQAIDGGAPPSLARIPMTPEEVADSYNEVWDDSEGEADGDGSKNEDPTAFLDSLLGTGEEPE